MDASKFDPGGFYEFQLAHGTLKTRDGARAVAISASIFARFAKALVESGDFAALKGWGAELGAQVGLVAGQRIDGLSPEAVMESVSTVLALAGLGRATLERFGDLAVLRLDAALEFDGAVGAYSALFEGLFESLSDAELACVPMMQDARFALVHPSVADEVRVWVSGGATAGEIAARLSAEESE